MWRWKCVAENERVRAARAAGGSRAQQIGGFGLASARYM
jgi:hypothetical protein